MSDSRTFASRLRRFGLAGVALALLGAVLTATPAQAAEPPPGGIKIQNVTSGLCLSPAGSSTADNATIVQYKCQSLAARTFDTTYNGTLHAYKIMNDFSRKCLSPAGGSTGLNVAIVQYTCDNDKSRYWNLVLKSGYWMLRNLKSGLCLSPAGGGTGLNTVIVQYTCDGSQARNWSLFVPMVFENENDGRLCATIAGASTTLNTAAVTYTCDQDQNPARLWELVATTTPNSVMLKNVGTGLCLSPAGGGTAINTLVVQYYCDGQTPRLWNIGDDGRGNSHIASNSTGLCLSPAGGSTGINTALVIYWCDTDPSRFWFVVPS